MLPSKFTKKPRKEGYEFVEFMTRNKRKFQIGFQISIILRYCCCCCCRLFSFPLFLNELNDSTMTKRVGRKRVGWQKGKANVHTIKKTKQNKEIGWNGVQIMASRKWKFLNVLNWRHSMPFFLSSFHIHRNEFVAINKHFLQTVFALAIRNVVNRKWNTRNISNLVRRVIVCVNGKDGNNGRGMRKKGGAKRELNLKRFSYYVRRVIRFAMFLFNRWKIANRPICVGDEIVFFLSLWIYGTLFVTN